MGQIPSITRIRFNTGMSAADRISSEESVDCSADGRRSALPPFASQAANSARRNSRR